MSTKNSLCRAVVLSMLLATEALPQDSHIITPYSSSPKSQIKKRPLPVIRTSLSPFSSTDHRLHESDNRQSEMSIAISPTDPERILVGANTINPQGNVFNQGYYYSSNGGSAWAGDDVLPGSGRWTADPAVAFDADGNAYFHYLNLYQAYVKKSTNGGATWEEYVGIPSVGNGDKGHIAADVTSGYFRNNVYVALTDFSITAGPIVLSRSTDQGESFETPVSISDDVASEWSQGVNLAIGPSGEVYAAWAIQDDWNAGRGSDGIGFNRSLDGGATWQKARRVFDIRGSRDMWFNKNPLGQDAPIRMNDFPCIAVDHSGGIWNGTIYMVWGNFGEGSDRADIHFSMSTDGGESWSNPRRVNDDSTHNDQWFPWITVNPHGVISIVFYDSRVDPNNQLTEVWVAQSADGGQSFSNFRVSDVSFMPFPIVGENVAGGYMGDYIGIASKTGQTYACWMDNREGDYQAYVDIIDTYQADLLALAYSNRALEIHATFSNSARHLAKGGDYLHEVFTSGGEIFYRQSTNEGSRWEITHRITAGNGNNSADCIAATQDGSLHVVWQHQTESMKWETWHRRSVDNGANWEEPTILGEVDVSEYQTNGAMPVIAYGMEECGGLLLAVFSSNEGLHYRVSEDNGVSWTDDALIAGQYDDRVEFPSLAGSPSHFSLVYDYVDDEYSPYSRIFDGSNWSNETSAGKETGAVLGAFSSVAIDADNNPICAWSGVANTWTRSVIFRAGYIDNSWSNWFVEFGQGQLGPDWLYPSLTYYNRDGNGQYGIAIVNHTSQNSIQLIRLVSLADPPQWDISTLSQSGAWANITHDNYYSGKPIHCWTDQTSSPYEVFVGSSSELSMMNPLALKQKRRAVVHHRVQNTTLTLEFEPIKIVTTSGDTTVVPFKRSSLRQQGIDLVTMWDYLGSDTIRLPVNARWLIMSKHFVTRGPSIAQRRFFFRVYNTNGVPIGLLDTTASSGTFAVNIAPYAAMSVILRPQVVLAGINPASVTTAVGDVFFERGGQTNPTLASHEASVINNLPRKFTLAQNYPNPFNPTTTINYDLPVDARVTLKVYDVLGREVVELANGYREAGYHSATWNAQDNASGVYFARFTVSNEFGRVQYSKMSKLMLIR